MTRNRNNAKELSNCFKSRFVFFFLLRFHWLLIFQTLHSLSLFIILLRNSLDWFLWLKKLPNDLCSNPFGMEAYHYYIILFSALKYPKFFIAASLDRTAAHFLKWGKFSRTNNLNNASKQYLKLLVGKRVFVNVKIELYLVKVLNRYQEHTFCWIILPSNNTLLIASFFLTYSSPY